MTLKNAFILTFDLVLCFLSPGDLIVCFDFLVICWFSYASIVFLLCSPIDSVSFQFLWFLFYPLIIFIYHVWSIGWIDRLQSTGNKIRRKLQKQIQKQSWKTKTQRRKTQRQEEKSNNITSCCCVLRCVEVGVVRCTESITQTIFTNYNLRKFFYINDRIE